MLQPKRFLFLQGPHGPFFHGLARVLQTSGATVWRVGFNQGDRVFWPNRSTYIAYRKTIEAWPAEIDTLLDKLDITDLVLYGDTRPIHATAIAAANIRGLTVHVFEEGYLRPYWITYERGGANGHSRLMSLSVDQMSRAMEGEQRDLIEAPAHWGDMRQHIFYGALYHFFVLTFNNGYKKLKSHRNISVTEEFLLYLKRLLTMPWTSLERRLAQYRIKMAGVPYHLVLLQLEHDASFRMHSPFNSMAEFLEKVIVGFADGAPKHHRLVIKAHPLEDGRSPIRATIRSLERKHGLQNRVHYVRGGKLAQLLKGATSAVTVNSTAGQQVLWRDLPLKIFGSAVYGKPEFISFQDIKAFFANPQRPNRQAYLAYRTFLLDTSQIPGGYYARNARRQLLRRISDVMLSEEDPYNPLLTQKATQFNTTRRP